MRHNKKLLSLSIQEVAQWKSNTSKKQPEIESVRKAPNVGFFRIELHPFHRREKQTDAFDLPSNRKGDPTLTPTLQLLFAAAGMGVVVFGWLHYLSLIGKEKVPKHPRFSLILMLTGSVFSVASWTVALLQRVPLSMLAFSLSLFAVGLALFFVYLLGQAPLPDQPIKLHVNEAFPALQVTDAYGQIHNTQDWRGQRFLFKFFRGHW